MYNTWWCVSPFPGSRATRHRRRAAPYDFQPRRPTGRVQARLSQACRSIVALRIALQLMPVWRMGPARVGEKVLRELGEFESRRRLVVRITIVTHVYTLDNWCISGEAIGCAKRRKRRVAAHCWARRVGHGSHDAADGAGDRDARFPPRRSILLGCYSKAPRIQDTPPNQRALVLLYAIATSCVFLPVLLLCCCCPLRSV